MNNTNIKLANKNRGQLFTIAAPSGAGKTSLVRALVNSVENLYVSVSHTTRAPRNEEQDGVNYFFVDDHVFQDMIERNDFLEYAKVFKHAYGTSKSQVEKQLASGKNVILEIDWQGVRQVYRQFPECTRIFILPPSIETLEQRLHHRAQDSELVIHDRIAGAKKEIAHWQEADFLVINDHFDTALEQLQSIVIHHCLKYPVEKTVYEHLIKKLLE